MSTRLDEALRDRLELRTVIVWFTLMAALYYFGTSLPQLATTTVMSAVLGLNKILADTYDLRESVKYVGLGAVAVLSGVVLLFVEGSVLLPVAFLLIGSWFVLNAVQTVRHEGATEPPRDGHDVYRDYVARRVHETLKERSQTRRELGESLDADDEAIDIAVERLLDRDVIERTGSEFRVSSSLARSRLDHVRIRIAGMARRIARPIAIEFDDSTRSKQEDSKTTGVGTGTDLNSSDSLKTDADREQDHEFTN
jgi:hypothetical protein